MYAPEKETRGKRNNNPLNIRHSKTFAWKGELFPDNDGFCRFSTLIYGIRACFALLRTYNIRYNIYSLRDIIERWAPPSENHTEIYIAYICSQTGYDPSTKIWYNSPYAVHLIKAMAKYESKMDLSIDVINQGFSILNRR